VRLIVQLTLELKHEQKALRALSEEGSRLRANCTT
jgi:hypothetical protein